MALITASSSLFKGLEIALISHSPGMFLSPVLNMLVIISHAVIFSIY